MNSKNIDTVLENQSLKSEFQLRNLELEQIWQPKLVVRRASSVGRVYLASPYALHSTPDDLFERWLAGKSI